ncbi:glycosyltransferase family 9 protein, partial [Salmonella enterica]|uniref:glycosyltransferase family 9 protein n=1 Tax=Salmonella enterica TaxID=28901 RepID=UPI00398C383D
FPPATRCSANRCPEAHCQEFAGLVVNTGSQRKLHWGGPHGEAGAKRLAEGFDYVDVLPRMSLEGVARVLAGAKFVVAVDTGLSHLTPAPARPNITLHGPTDTGLLGGSRKHQMACCSPKHNRLTLEP